MENKKSGYDGLFWGLGVAAVAGLLGSAYYIYTLLNPEEELTEEEMMQIQDLKEELSVEDGQPKPLTVDRAVQIMSLTNKISEEMIKKLKPDLDDRRRAAINNPEEYERVCQEVFESKEYAYSDAIRKVLSQFGEVSIEEIQRLMSTVSPIEIEKINHKYDKPFQSDAPKPPKDLVKKAFIFYGKRFATEMREFQKIISQQGQITDPSQEQYFFFRLLTLKMKVDDELFIEYKYTEPQIKYMLYEYNLMEDPEVRRVTEQLMRFDQMLAPPEEM